MIKCNILIGHQLGDASAVNLFGTTTSEDLDKLRSLGIEKVHAEIEIKIQSSPIPLDEFVECPNCQVPLMTII